jgi:hypothetical protein
MAELTAQVTSSAEPAGASSANQHPSGKRSAVACHLIHRSTQVIPVTLGHLTSVQGHPNPDRGVVRPPLGLEGGLGVHGRR